MDSEGKRPEKMSYQRREWVGREDSAKFNGKRTVEFVKVRAKASVGMGIEGMEGKER